MGTKVNLYKQSGTDDGTSVNFNLPRSLTYGLNARANDDGGVTESDNCEYNTLNGLSTLLKSSSLIITPNSYKEGKLYSVIPSSGAGDMSVVRATTATRVNSAGLVELVPYNLFRYSEQFDNGAWVKASATITTNATIAPNGTLTADKAIATNTASATRAIYQGFTPILDSTYNISVYVKAAEYTKFTISEIGNGRFGASFDLVAETSTSLGGLSYVSSLITNEGNSWYKCSIVATGSAVGWAVGFMGYPDGATPSTSGVSYAGNGVSGVFIWGAQLVESSISKAYFPTTDRLNIPRLDYSLGSCPNILLEPQRTNLALRSEEFENATIWTNTIGGTGANPIRTANAVTSPSGIQNADTIVFDRGAGNTITDQSVISQQITIATTGTYYFSVWIKATASGDVGKQVFIRCGNAAALQAVTLTANWVRYETTATVTSGSNSFQVGNRGAITNANSVSVDLWGAQLEAGAYATSYIPTTSASVTRNQDIVNKTGISSLIGQTEGVIYWEGIATMQTDILGTNRSTVNGIYITKGSGNLFRVSIYNSSNTTTLADTIIRNSNTKIAVSYKSGNTSLFVNGVKVATSSDSLTFNASIDAIRLNDNYLVGINSYFTKSVLVYKTALTDTQCIALTT
jgi:hypothetical protein